MQFEITAVVNYAINQEYVVSFHHIFASFLSLYFYLKTNQVEISTGDDLHISQYVV